MNTLPTPLASPVLRQQAEAQWQAITQKSPEVETNLAQIDIQSLLHELQVHQIELELQNEELRRARDALDASRTRYVDLYDLAPVGYCSVSESGLLVQANLTLATLLGVTRSTLARQPPFTNFVMQPDQDSWYMLRTKMLESGLPQTCELRMRQGQGYGHGGFVWVQLVATVTQDDACPRVMHIAVSDITERKQAEAKLKLAASVFACAREGIIITDAKATILDVNQAFTRITGYSRVEVIGQKPRILKSDRQDSAFYDGMWFELTAHGHWSGEIWNRHKHGRVYAELLTISAVRDDLGITQQYVGLFSDITAIKDHQHQLEHIAHFDALTDLPNRVLLADRLQQAMAQALRRCKQLAVVYLDLDGFKAVNDNQGHGVGDRVLITLAHHMKETLREGDTLARLGGDEFVAVLIDLEDTADCLPLVIRLQVAAAQSMQVGEVCLQISASLGITFYPQAQDMDADQLLRQAD